MKRKAGFDGDQSDHESQIMSERDIKLDFKELESKFENFCKTSENMSSFLNSRATKKKFEEFH